MGFAMSGVEVVILLTVQPDTDKKISLMLVITSTPAFTSVGTRASSE